MYKFLKMHFIQTESVNYIQGTGENKTKTKNKPEDKTKKKQNKIKTAPDSPPTNQGQKPKPKPDLKLLENPDLNRSICRPNYGAKQHTVTCRQVLGAEWC